MVAHYYHAIVQRHRESLPPPQDSLTFVGVQERRVRLDGSPYANLTQLDVSENSIECLDLTALDKLQSVQCSRNKLQDLSLNGAALSSLIAGNNCLTRLLIHPKPTKLKHLDISYNRLEFLPDWLASCQHLRTLFASHNLLTSLPEHIFCSELSSLQTLQLSFNHLTSLPQVIRHIPLQQLFLQSNRIRELPHHFFLATSRLRILNLSKNNLSELPPVIADGHQLERLYLTCNNLTDVQVLTKFTNLRVLHVGYNLCSKLPDYCVGSWPDMEELIFSGNRIERLPENVSQWQHLRVLRLHCNLLNGCPSLAPSTSLKVLDLSHNNLDKLDLISLVPKQLQFLDISGNNRLSVDPKQFQNYKSKRRVSLVDVSGQNRDSLPSGTSERTSHEGNANPWNLGFSETPGNREKLCIAQLRLTSFCSSEALLGLFDSGNNTELPKMLAESIPRILLEERTVKETANEYMKYTLLAAHRELKEKGQRVGVCAMVCHICSERGSGVRKRTLRIATVGEAKAVLCRGETSVTLAHVPTQTSRSQIGNSAMFPLVVPDPHVTELTLKETDEFLVMANKRLWEVVTPEDAVTEVRTLREPVMAAKRLQDLAQSYGCEDNLSVMVVRFHSNQDQLMRELNYAFQVPESNTVDSFRHPAVGCSSRKEIYSDCVSSESNCWCQGDRSSPSGQSDQASYGRTSSKDNYYMTDQEIIDRHNYPSVLMRENGTRKMTSKLAKEHLACDYDAASISDRSAPLSDEQFRCWEYMLEQNTQMLFDKELDTLSRGFARRPSRPAMSWTKAKSTSHLNDPSLFSRAFGSTRSFQSALTGKFGAPSTRRPMHAGPNAAYFGSLQRLMPYHLEYDFSIIKERSEVDSLETEDRMSKYWDVATTEL